MSTINEEQYMARLKGVVSAGIHSKQVLIVGIGGGADMAVKLARHGVGHLHIADPDIVEPENLCRTCYTALDVGRTKVDALTDHLRVAAPFTKVTAHHTDILTWNDAQVRKVLTGVDLIIAGTDSFAAQAKINRWSQHYNTPALFIGIHAGSLGGMIVWSIPRETSCYRCIAADRYTAKERGTDLTLPGATGSMADIAFIDSIALKLSLGLLERGQSSSYGDWFAALTHGQHGKKARNQVVVRMDPSYSWDGIDLFSLVLSDLPTTPKPYQAELEAEAFFACDSLWLVTTPNPACPDCASYHKETTS